MCTPVLVSHFTNHPVQQIACGDAHVVALTLDGAVYTWGCGEYGRLGLGSEDDHFTPQVSNLYGYLNQRQSYGTLKFNANLWLDPEQRP